MQAPTRGSGISRMKGRRPKHVPERMCVACRQRTPKRGLVRIVRTPEGPIAIDPTGKRNGRGAYLCQQPDCWDRALRTGALSRALNTAVSPDVESALREYATTLPALTLPSVKAVGVGAANEENSP